MDPPRLVKNNSLIGVRPWAIGLAVPSINPKQFCNGAPVWATALSYLCSASGSMTSGYHWCIRCWWVLDFKLDFIRTLFVIMLNTGTGRENLGITCQSNLNRACQTFENEVPWFHLLCFAHCRKKKCNRLRGICSVSVSIRISRFRTLNSATHSSSSVSSMTNAGYTSYGKSRF